MKAIQETDIYKTIKDNKIEIYYENKKGVLLLGDGLEIMDKLGYGVVDEIICDLPYGVTRHRNDKVFPIDKLWRMIKKVRKEQSNIVLFGMGIYYYKLIIGNADEYRYDLIWDKILSTGFLNSGHMPLREHENMAVFYKKAGVYNAQMWLGKPLHGKGRKSNKKNTKNSNYGEFNIIKDKAGKVEKEPRSIIKIMKDHPSKVEHPTQKPVSLMKYLVKTYSNEGEIILDFASGSGSTLIASNILNRYWIGIEIDEKVCEIAKKRIEEEDRQLRMFVI